MRQQDLILVTATHKRFVSGLVKPIMLDQTEASRCVLTLECPANEESDLVIGKCTD